MIIHVKYFKLTKSLQNIKIMEHNYSLSVCSIDGTDIFA